MLRFRALSESHSIECPGLAEFARIRLRRKPILKPLLVLLALSFGLATGACRSSKEANKIEIGHYASMTGSEATFGTSTDKGIRLALDEINKAGGVKGKQVKIITYDDKGDNRETGSAV